MKNLEEEIKQPEDVDVKMKDTTAQIDEFVAATNNSSASMPLDKMKSDEIG